MGLTISPDSSTAFQSISKEPSMSNFQFPSVKLLIPVLVTGVLLAACGGGGGVSLANVGSGGTGFITGSVTKGPVGSANVTAYSVSGGQMGAQIGTAMTDTGGNFQVNIGSYAGAVMLQVNGGSYTDEATGSVMPIAIGDVMTAIMPTMIAGSNVSGIQVTPLTAMAQALAQHMTGGMTDSNITAAHTAIGGRFSVSDVLHIQPMNPLVNGSGSGASQDSQNYGMTLAAISQYAKTLGMTTSSSMVTAMMNDASDGIFDGKAAGSPIQVGGMGGMSVGTMMSATAGTSGMGEAMSAFMNSALNKSGVKTTDLVTKLMGASGQISTSMPVLTNALVSGTAFNGPLSSGTMTAFAINGGAVGAQIASVATDSQGNFAIPLGSYNGAVMLQLTGASYTDEASKTTMTMTQSDVMSAVLPKIGTGANVTGVMVTPVTAMAQSRALGMSGGMTDANIASANTAMGTYFGINDILHTQPMNPTIAGSGASASQDARNYGMTLAAMSEYAKTLNMPISSALIGSMMEDAFDGVMNGKNGNTQIPMSTGGMGSMGGTSMMNTSAGTSSLVDSMTSFMNSAANASGLKTADMLTLMQKLNSSGGKI
jgi:hypothetical protein